MTWKDILKAQTTLLQFSRQANMDKKIPEIRAKLEGMRGRAKTTERGKTEDLATVKLEQLDKVRNVDDFENFYDDSLKYLLGEK
tara:strand:+ start:552 stop:803 length:252 start_codon:yes stop_codon:yes gene_type:complete